MGKPRFEPTNTFADARRMIGDYLSRTDYPAASNARGPALRDQMVDAMTGTPVGLNRLGQAIYDFGPSASREVKAIGVGVLGVMILLRQERIGGLREDATAMRLALLREIDADMPDGFSFPDASDDPWRSTAPAPPAGVGRPTRSILSASA
jgi:hypothetical protein